MFQPPIFLKNPVLQSYVGAFFPVRSLVPSKREQIILNNDEDMTFEYFITPPPIQNKTQHYILILHAWLGDAFKPYVKDMANQAWKMGFGVIRIHQRDHGGNERLTKTPYHTARHQEMSNLIEAIVQKHAIQRYSLVGFSVGASLALRIVSLKQDARLKSLVAISPYTHLETALKNIDKNSYAQRCFLYRGLMGQISRKVKVYPGLYSLDFLKGVPRTCLDTVRFLTTHHYGFHSPEEYFAASDLRNFPLSKIGVPTLVIASKDDPVSDVDNYQKMEWSKTTQFLLTDKGGHIGFVHHNRLPTGSFRWAQYQAVQFICDKVRH